MAVFADELSAEQRREVDGVTLSATRHGRTSTTLVLAAPVPARPHLVRCMRAAAERAFGEHVDVDGLVSRDGDVLVRITWDPRHPVSGRVLELVGPGAGAALWPTPRLVPLLLLYDRQEFEANWYALSNVLLAAPAGGNVDVPLERAGCVARECVATRGIWGWSCWHSRTPCRRSWDASHTDCSTP